MKLRPRRNIRVFRILMLAQLVAMALLFAMVILWYRIRSGQI